MVTLQNNSYDHYSCCTQINTKQYEYTGKLVMFIIHDTCNHLNLPWVSYPRVNYLFLLFCCNRAFVVIKVLS